MLDLGHERHRRGRRLERVERGPDRRVADPVDLGRDAAGGRALDALAQLAGLGDPHAPPALGRQRAIGFRLDVGQQRRRPRPERAIREAFLPADPGTTPGVRAEDRAAAQPAGQRRLEGVVAERRQHTDRQPLELGQVRVGRVRPIQVRIRRERARVVGGDDP